MPIRPPIKQSSSASRTKDSRTARRENPIARSVPISRERAATRAYIVFMAPSELPIAMQIASTHATTLIGAEASSCWSA